MSKIAVVFGGSGAIGSAIVDALLAAKYSVIAVARDTAKLMTTRDSCRSGRPFVNGDINVTSRASIDDFCGQAFYKPNRKAALVVFTVGNCPPYGFAEEIGTPMAAFSSGRLRIEFEREVLGCHNVMQQMLPCLEDGGAMVIVGSRITRILEIPREARPPKLHAYHHIAAVLAKKAIIEGYRMSPEVVARKIRVQWVAPPAVDTPFHAGEPKPPVMVSREMVAEAVVKAAENLETVDVNVGP